LTPNNVERSAIWAARSTFFPLGGMNVERAAMPTVLST
jgi:hypothetical protein